MQKHLSSDEQKNLRKTLHEKMTRFVEEHEEEMEQTKSYTKFDDLFNVGTGIFERLATSDDRKRIPQRRVYVMKYAC